MENTEPEDDQAIEIEEIPHGRKLTPTGSAFRMSAERLSKLTKLELAGQIQEYKNQVADAQSNLDVQRVHLALAQNEMEHREVEEARKLRATSKPFMSSTGTVKVPISIDRKRRSSPDVRSNFFEKTDEWLAQGLTPEEIGRKLMDLMKGGH